MGWHWRAKWWSALNHKKNSAADDFYEAIKSGTDLSTLQNRANITTLAQDVEKGELVNKDTREFLKLRLFWGKTVFWLLVFVIGYNAILVYLVGTGKWKFQNDTFLNIAVGQNFVQVLGLVGIVLKALFPSTPKDS